MGAQSSIAAILTLQFTIFALILVGFFLRRREMIGAQGQKNLTDLVVNVILPCNILVAFQNGADRERIASYFSIFLVAVAVQAISYFYGKWAFRRAPKNQQDCLRYATICPNAGFIGNPVAEGMYGAEGLALASVYLIPLRIMMWSSGLSMFTGEHDRKAVLRRVVTHPCILACAAGIVLMLTGVRLLAVLLSPVSELARCNTAASMLVIGMILARIDFRRFMDRSVLIYCLHRLVLLPALFYVLFRFLPVDPLVFKISVLLTAMPAGATTSILAEKYGRDSEYATKLVIVSTLLSIPSMFVWSLILA